VKTISDKSPPSFRVFPVSLLQKHRPPSAGEIVQYRFLYLPKPFDRLFGLKRVRFIVSSFQNEKNCDDDNKHTLRYSSTRKGIDWNVEKNRLSMSEKGILFDDVLFALLSGRLLDDPVHPNNFKYPNTHKNTGEIHSFPTK
jgi:hypothetical protein